MKLKIELPDEYYEVLQKLSDEHCLADTLILKYGTPLSEKKCRWMQNWNAEGKRWKCSACGGFVLADPADFKCCPYCMAETEVKK